VLFEVDLARLEFHLIPDVGGRGNGTETEAHAVWIDQSPSIVPKGLGSLECLGLCKDIMCLYPFGRDRSFAIENHQVFILV
jgi:hypothetical protein